MISTLQSGSAQTLLRKVPPWPREPGMNFSAARSELWLPAGGLTACVRGVMARDTRGVVLGDHERFNHMPATPTCTLLWYLHGDCEVLAPGAAASLESPRVPIGRTTLCGPFTQPVTSWNPGASHAFMVLLMPDALSGLTGIDTMALLNRAVAVDEVLDAEWQDFCAQVAAAPDDEARLGLVAGFLLPRWQRVGPQKTWRGHHINEWLQNLAVHSRTSGWGRSLRQVERRIKQWTGQTERSLQVLGRSEQAFFAAAAAEQSGQVQWSGIADEAGYADQSHFCREARRVTGFAPEEFRRRMKTDEGFWGYRLWAAGV